MTKLYTFWRSSAAYRVRIAMGLKGLSWQNVPVHLAQGEHKAEAYLAKNPIGLVPALELADGQVLTQSLAILDWLEETHPERPILPSDPFHRARVRAAAHTLAVDTHPIQNVGVVAHFKGFGHDQEAGTAWMVHWMTRGFGAFQTLIDPESPFCFGETPGLADICLVPQLYNAHRCGLDLGRFERLTQIEARCLAHPAFDAARPENQPDAE